MKVWSVDQVWTMPILAHSFLRKTALFLLNGLTCSQCLNAQMKAVAARAWHGSRCWDGRITVTHHGCLLNLLTRPLAGVMVWATTPVVTPISSQVIEHTRLDRRLLRPIFGGAQKSGTSRWKCCCLHLHLKCIRKSRASCLFLSFQRMACMHCCCHLKHNLWLDVSDFLGRVYMFVRMQCVYTV